jgi:hypothetical protein
VDWSKQQKANLHTHTKLTTVNDIVYGSDGNLTQQEIIDRYYNAGYKILAITDHDFIGQSLVTTWPWTLFDRDSETLGMLAIQGKELSRGDHILSLFNDLGISSTDDEIVTLKAIADNGGISIIAHPGRYEETKEWYAQLIKNYEDIVCGMEVYNQGDKYPNDRQTWDLVNAILIPAGKIAYGFSNDDCHGTTTILKSYQFVLSDLNEAAVNDALLTGKTYFCYEPGASGEAKAPRITNIVVDKTAKTITISADSGTITWYTEDTEAVGTETIFNYAGFEKTFVRAEITNDFGITCTQPFVFTTPKDSVEKTYGKDNNMWLDAERKSNASL